MKRPPKVRLATAEPLQDYYRDGEGNQYSVARLCDDSKALPVFDMPLAGISLSSKPWDGDNMTWLAFHVKKCMDADLTRPILFDWNGDVADGRHRIIKAIALGKTTIKARRIWWRPTPCKPAEAA